MTPGARVPGPPAPPWPHHRPPGLEPLMKPFRSPTTTGAAKPTPSTHGAPGTDARRGLEAVFRPRSIAVIGASRERGTIGGEIFHNLLEQGFQGVVHPVNPNAGVVQSVRAYPTIADVPD